MASESIIIECNRQIALKQELDNLGGIVEDPHNRFEPPNNKWKNVISSGIQVNTGDQVAVEATMINTKGSPDETMEFLGSNNSTNSADLVDNECELELNFYITNNRQFNFSMPSHEVNNSQASSVDPTSITYGLPLVDTFANFRKAYPYDAYEGFVYELGNPDADPPTTAGYKSTPMVNAPLTNPPEGLVNINTKRLYAIDGFVPSNAIGDLPSKPASKRKVDLRLNVEEGFNTPDAVANRLTSQLQGRFGDATGWSQNFVENLQFDAGGDGGGVGPLKFFKAAATTTPTYATIPTASGDLCFGRLNGTYTGAFEGETAGNGANYTEKGGFFHLFGNLLSDAPDVYCAKTDLWNHLHDNATATTGFDNTNFESNGIAKVNEFEICFADTQDSVAGTSAISVATSRTANTSIADPLLLKLEENSLVVSNIVYNGENLQRIKTLFRASEYISTLNQEQVANFDPRNTAVNKFFEMEMAYGRPCEEACLGANQSVVNLSPPDFQASGANPGFNSYIQTTAGSTGNKYRLGVNIAQGGAGVPGGAVMRNGIRQNFFVNKTRWDDAAYTAITNTASLFPASSIFTLKNSEGFQYPITLSQAENVMIVPVFYKAANLPDPSMRDVPFCALVSMRTQTQGLYPVKGENLGICNIDFYSNHIAKPATTQKKNTQTFGSPNYPGVDAAFTLNYMACCFIGADAPQVKFDSNGDGRFSLATFHTQLRTGNGTFQVQPAKSNPQAGQIIASAGSSNGYFSGLNASGLAEIPPNFIQDNDPLPWITAQGGISIAKYSVPNKKDGSMRVLQTYNTDAFKSTLFSKLGFKIEQILPLAGSVQGEFNRDNYNRFLGTNQSIYKKQENMIKPFTTNGFISAFAMVAGVQNNANMPMENLGTLATAVNSGPNPANIDCESDELIAIDLPSKLDFSYLVVNSDIVQNTQFYGGASGQQKVPAMAYISRNYSEGDYFYSFTTNWSYTADRDYVISEINTNITLPNGEPAPIEPNSSVIYKITKPKILPPAAVVNKPVEHEHRAPHETKGRN